MTTEKTIYVCSGSVCGDCGGHATLRQARQCLRAHRRGIDRLPSSPHGAPYSDRRIVRADGEPFGLDERTELSGLDEEDHAREMDLRYRHPGLSELALDVVRGE